MYTHSIHTQYICQKHCDTERYLYILYNVVVALSSLTGDTIVLVASIKYAFDNLTKIKVWGKYQAMMVMASAKKPPPAPRQS